MGGMFWVAGVAMTDSSVSRDSADFRGNRNVQVNPPQAEQVIIRNILRYTVYQNGPRLQENKKSGKVDDEGDHAWRNYMNFGSKTIWGIGVALVPRSWCFGLSSSGSYPLLLSPPRLHGKLGLVSGAVWGVAKPISTKVIGVGLA